MYNKYAETGRVQFTHNHAEHATGEERQQWLDLVTPKNLGLILKSIKTEYKFVHLLDSPHILLLLIHPYSLWNIQTALPSSTNFSKHRHTNQHPSKRKRGFCQRSTNVLQRSVSRILPFMTILLPRSRCWSRSWWRSFSRLSSCNRTGKRRIVRMRISCSRLLRSSGASTSRLETRSLDIWCTDEISWSVLLKGLQSQTADRFWAQQTQQDRHYWINLAHHQPHCYWPMEFSCFLFQLAYTYSR